MQRAHQPMNPFDQLLHLKAYKPRIKSAHAAQGLEHSWFNSESENPDHGPQSDLRLSQQWSALGLPMKTAFK